MKRIGIAGIFCLALTSMNAQESPDNKINNPSYVEPANKFYNENHKIDNSLSKDFFMEIIEPKILFRNSIRMNNMSYPLFNNKQNRFSLITYNESLIYIGLGNVENIGAKLKWDLSKNISLDGGFFLSRQYGYILHSRHITNGMNINFNYKINPKFMFNLGGQNIFRQNEDPFMLHSNMLPQTGIRANLESTPNPNTKMSVGAELQESIYDPKKYEVNVEAKTSITF